MIRATIPATLSHTVTAISTAIPSARNPFSKSCSTETPKSRTEKVPKRGLLFPGTEARGPDILQIEEAFLLRCGVSRRGELPPPASDQDHRAQGWIWRCPSSLEPLTHASRGCACLTSAPATCAPRERTRAHLWARFGSPQGPRGCSAPAFGPAAARTLWPDRDRGGGGSCLVWRSDKGGRSRRSRTSGDRDQDSGRRHSEQDGCDEPERSRTCARIPLSPALSARGKFVSIPPNGGCRQKSFGSF
jgi:hypothetical protein